MTAKILQFPTPEKPLKLKEITLVDKGNCYILSIFLDNGVGTMMAIDKVVNADIVIKAFRETVACLEELKRED